MTKKILPTDNTPWFGLTSGATIKISLWRFIIDPFKILCTNWQIFFLLAVPTAILLTLSSFGFGRTTLCNINNELSLTSDICSDKSLNFYGNLFICFLILTIFAVKWYQFAIQKQPFTLKNLTNFNRRQIKSIGWMTVFTLINLSPLFALIILFLRVPNPVWQKELIFFTSVAWVFLLPILALRFYSLIAFSLEDRKSPSFKVIWNTTAGNMIKILLGTAVVVFLTLYVFMQYYVSIQAMTQTSFIATLTIEFEYNLLIALFIIICVNYCYTQKELFFKGE